MSTRLIALDLDGTLLDSRKRLPERKGNFDSPLYGTHCERNSRGSAEYTGSPLCRHG